MFYCKASFVILFLTFCKTLVIAQSEAKFDRLTRTDGLSHNNVNSIIQDRYGFMWFGTQDGLNRYDGFSFKYFYNDPSNLNSLISSNITYIFQGTKGYLWFGSYYNGLDRYDPLKNEFRHYNFIENENNSLSDNHIRSITEDKTGNLWIATSGGGLNHLNIVSEEFKHYLHDARNTNSISSNEVNVLEPAKDGLLWIGTDSNLDLFDPKSNKFTHYVLGYESFDQTKQLSVNALHLDKNNILWIGTSDGLFTFNKDKNIFKQYKHNIADPLSISDDNINTIFGDSNGNIWIGTENGLNRFSSEKKSFESFFVDNTDRNSISSNQINCLCEDRANILWIGTKGGGSNKLDLKRKRFHNLRYTSDGQLGLPHPNVSSIVGDTAGNVWISTYGGGVCLFNIRKNSIKSLSHKPNKRSLLSDDQVLSSVCRKNIVWLGMRTGGLNSIEFINGEFKIKKYQKNNDSTGISNNQVNSLLIDKDGFLWIGTRDGLNKRIDTAQNGIEYFITYKRNYSDKSSLSENNISALYQDHKGFVWIGTYSNGLNRLNPETGKIDHFISIINNTSTLGSNSIHNIFEDHLGILWIGTSGGGLNMLNENGTSFTRYMIKDGLASNEVMAVLEDYSGFLWISTSKGLSKFDPLSKQFTNFDITDGLINDGFNISSAYQDGMGWMYFGTTAGMVYFHPTEIQLNPHQPDIVITKFSFLSNNKWSANDLFVTKFNQDESKIVLDYDKNFFSIEFEAMDFTNPSENQFQYKIEGLNDKWVDYGNNRSLMITNLEPGNYTFKIRGTNNDGIFNEVGISLPIEIRPPFWETKGFYFILFIVALFLAISIYSFLLKLKTNKLLETKNYELEQANQRLIESENNLKELNNTKDKFFSIIAHDLRNPFNPLLALTELLDNDYKDLEENERISFIKEIRHGAKKLYDLLENLLNWALSQTKRIKFNQVELDINEIIKDNIELLTINAEKKGISISDNCVDEAFVFADENMLNSVIRNLLNNAVKFSPDNSKVDVIVYEEDELYKIEVKDEGPGIPEEKQEILFSGFSNNSINNAKGKGSGLGLILCKEFVEKNNGKIWVESANGKGSSFFFTVKKP